MATKKCKICGKPMRCPHCDGAAGGRKSRRTINDKQQAELQVARQAARRWANGKYVSGQGGMGQR